MEFQLQYEFVQSSRQVLLAYCQGISEADFVAESSSFGSGSIRNLLVHIGNTYELWIGKHALNYKIDFTEHQSVKNVSDARAFFFSIDSLVTKFIDIYSDRYLEDLELDNNGQKIIASPLKLFTHVITHEFHHKGQILSFSRHLGYIPIDTDVMR